MAIKNTLRWVAVLPGAVAAFYVGYWITKAHLLGELLSSCFCIVVVPLTWINAGTSFFGCFASGMAFVTAGAYIAPRGRFPTACALAAVAFLLVAIAFAAVVLAKDWGQTPYFIATWIGAGLGAAYVFQSENQG